MTFEIRFPNKTLIFDSDLEGLEIAGKEYISGKDGVLIYDQVQGLTSDAVSLQMSANTSTLIPALKVLSIPYHPYFDKREVLESQNDITFYWNKSKLADYYNQFSTDELDVKVREDTIRKAVAFLLEHAEKLPLKDVHLTRMNELPHLKGFYKGFPIYGSDKGFAKLQSRLGIHLDPDCIMISTPLDEYEKDVYSLARHIQEKTNIEYIEKKNRVVFPLSEKVLRELGC